MKQLLSEWDEEVRRDPALDGPGCAALESWQLKHGASFADRPLCKVLRPAFVSRPELERLKRVCGQVATAIRKVRAWLLSAEDAAQVLDLPPETMALVRIDPGFDRLGITTRLDAFATSSAFSFVELNAEAPAGIAYHDVLARMFDGFAAMKTLRQRAEVWPLRVTGVLLRALLTTYNEWGRGAGKPRIAIVDWRDSPTEAEFRLLSDAFSRVGYPTVVADPRDLEYRSGRLYAAGRRIDLVYRRVLLEDCLARPQEVAALTSAVTSRAVCMVNPFRAHLLHRKRLFAYLTDPSIELRFSAEELAVIRQHVPWTRLVAPGLTQGPKGDDVDLISFVRAHRSELVIKPDEDYGGHGVCLGWAVSEARWDEVIEAALRRPHVVQCRVPVHSMSFPLMDASGGTADFLVDRDPFLFRGKVGGFLTRLAGGELANVTAGGGMVPTFVVES
ncbi:MAG: hypothetical protein CMP23_06890 [Rickettsiales bacterium]|nr:hypothetical protein [Rickettsiales bacterium]